MKNQALALFSNDTKLMLPKVPEARFIPANILRALEKEEKISSLKQFNSWCKHSLMMVIHNCLIVL